MLDCLPFEVQVEIFKRLPIKSLLQFRSVSTSWKSLIDDPGFISAHYSAQQTQLQLLVRYAHRSRHKDLFSIVDDETFPHQSVSLNVPLRLQKYFIMGCDHGLLGMYCTHLEGHGDPKPRVGMAVIWNLSIRKSVGVVVPNLGKGNHLGFGVCRETNDPRIVKIKMADWQFDEEGIGYIPWQVEVFTLRTRAWRSPYNINLPRISSTNLLSRVVVDGILYWLAAEKSKRYKLWIVSFDLTSEEFRKVNLPDSLAQQPEFSLTLLKLHGSLEVIESHGPFSSDGVVWMMEDCATKIFTKLFTIDLTSIVIARGFRSSGEPIIEIIDDIVALVLYDTCSKHIKDLGFSGEDFSFSLYPYKETLLLLDQPYFMIYN